MVDELVKLKKRFDFLMNELLSELKRMERKLNEVKIDINVMIDTRDPEFKLLWELYETDYRVKVCYKGSRYLFEDCAEDVQVKMFERFPYLILELERVIKSRIAKLEDVQKFFNEKGRF